MKRSATRSRGMAVHRLVSDVEPAAAGQARQLAAGLGPGERRAHPLVVLQVRGRRPGHRRLDDHLPAHGLCVLPLLERSAPCHSLPGCGPSAGFRAWVSIATMSRSVTIPTSRPSSTTGSEPTRRWNIVSAAWTTVASGYVVITDHV